MDLAVIKVRAGTKFMTFFFIVLNILYNHAKNL